VRAAQGSHSPRKSYVLTEDMAADELTKLLLLKITANSCAPSDSRTYSPLSSEVEVKKIKNKKEGLHSTSRSQAYGGYWREGWVSTKGDRNFTSARPRNILSTPICLMIVRLTMILLSSSPIYSALFLVYSIKTRLSSTQLAMPVLVRTVTTTFRHDSPLPY
jgi:hypothetical protein